MNDATPPNRCRIVLIAPRDTPAERIAAAFEGGDVASLILPENGMDEAAFQAFAEQIVEFFLSRLLALQHHVALLHQPRVQIDGFPPRVDPR